MKRVILFFVCVLFYQFTYGQGISVQGIARDTDKAALVDEQLTFTFEIQEDAGGTSYYKEDVQIRTDPYGVFSHIIGTGNVLAGSGNFNEIPYGLTHMKLVIKVDYDGSDITLSDAPFQYSPYAKSAENGVPTGTIVAFAGAEGNIPFGWTLCDGRALNTVDGSANLIDLIGANAPDLQGMFLRGIGTSPVNGEDGPALRGTQQDGFESHLHGKGTLDVPASSGTHTHTTNFPSDWSYGDSDDGATKNLVQSGDDGNVSKNTTGGGGGHDHSITGSTANSGTNETRPVNYGVNYIIKL